MPHLKIRLNGTEENPFHIFGLTQNPFPQDPKYETTGAQLALQSLGGNPIPDTGYIRAKLQGHFTAEFIELCCKHFVKGEMITFQVNWP